MTATTPANSYYMPVGSPDFSKIPLWVEQFIKARRNDRYWVQMLVHNQGQDEEGVRPAEAIFGLDLSGPVTLSSQYECKDLFCKSMSQENITDMWNRHEHEFDGIFKRYDGSYFFWRNPINPGPGDKASCESPSDEPLPVTLTKQEAAALYVWGILPSKAGARQCDRAPNGEFYYARGILEGIVRDNIKSQLDNYNAAKICMEQEATNSSCNPFNLPMDVPLNKTKRIRSYMRNEDTENALKKGWDAVKVPIEWLGIGSAFALTSIWVAKRFGRGSLAAVLLPEEAMDAVIKTFECSVLERDTDECRMLRKIGDEAARRRENLL